MKELPYKVLDLESKIEEQVIQLTSNSFLISQTKRGKEGINCIQWFSLKQYTDKFKEI
jgi:hypothetical protein